MRTAKFDYVDEFQCRVVLEFLIFGWVPVKKMREI